MADHLSVEGRSRVMAAIRSKDTKPELAVRFGLRVAGASGYRIHVKTLPGKPDIAFTRWRVAVFVDGAYWHGHPEHFKPDTAARYWREKIARTQQRDQAADLALREAGWMVVRCWDFEVKVDTAMIVERIIRVLASQGWRPSVRSGSPLEADDPGL